MTSSGVFIAKFEHISHLFLVFLLLTLSRIMPAGNLREKHYFHWFIDRSQSPKFVCFDKEYQPEIPTRLTVLVPTTFQQSRQFFAMDKTIFFSMKTEEYREESETFSSCSNKFLQNPKQLIPKKKCTIASGDIHILTRMSLMNIMYFFFGDC